MILCSPWPLWLVSGFVEFTAVDRGDPHRWIDGLGHHALGKGVIVVSRKGAMLSDADHMEGWEDVGNSTNGLEQFDLTANDDDPFANQEVFSTNPVLHHDPNQVLQGQGSQHQAASSVGLSPFGAAILALDLEMDLDDHGWSAEKWDDDQSSASELDLDQDVPASWLGQDGFIESNWLMDQSALDATLEALGLVNERLALQDGEEQKLLEQLIQHHQLTISSRQKAFHLQQLRRAIRDALTKLPMQKRVRGDHTSASLQRIYDVIATTSSTRRQQQANVNEWDFVSTQMPPKGRRRQAFLQQHYPGSSRADLEARQRAGLIDQVLSILTAAGAPIIEASTESNFPRATVEGSVGATRPGTMVTYIRSFRSFLDYLFICTGLRWPTKFTQVTDFLHMKGNEPCSASIPQVFIQALAWFEKTAGVPGGQHFSKHDVVKRTVDSITEKVAVGNPPLKQAPRIPAVMVASMELYVCDTTRPTGLRMKSFGQLLKVFCTLREDDLQHLDPRRLRVSGEVVISELLRTKTTGRTKRIKELPLVLWVGASVTGSSWLETGLSEIENFGDKELSLIHI